MTEFAGTTIKNYLVAASSPLTESVQRLKLCEKAGFGAAVLKSCDPINRGIPYFPRKVLYADNGFYAYGSYPGEIMRLEEALKLYDSVENSSMLVIPSISCLSFDFSEWLRGCTAFSERGARIIQLDLFYIASKIKENPALVKNLAGLLRELTKRLDRIVFMPKLNVNFDAGTICRIMRESGIHCVSLLDSIRKVPPKDSGLDPDGTSFFSNEMFNVTKYYLNTALSFGLEVMAGGGVHSKRDVDELISIGAKAVQVASFVLMNGYSYVPTLFGKKPNHLLSQCPWCDRAFGSDCTKCGGCFGRPFFEKGNVLHDTERKNQEIIM